MKLTRAPRDALLWLSKHNGTGVFDNNGVLLAAGETAPTTRRTWNALRDSGHVVNVGRRVHITPEGAAQCSHS